MLTPEEIAQKRAELNQRREAEEARRKALPQLPEYDELTHRKLLVKSDLKDGSYYVGRCRNASVARWNAKEQCFLHWREKMGSLFIEPINHPADEEKFDVFRVLYELEDPGFVIPFDRETADQIADHPPAEFRSNLVAHDDEVWCSCNTENFCVVGMDAAGESHRTTRKL